MCGQEQHLVEKWRDALQPRSPSMASPLPLAASGTPPCWPWCPAQRTKPWHGQCCSWCQSTWWRQGSWSGRWRELLQGCPQAICHCACWSCNPPSRVFHPWRNEFGQLDCSWASPGGSWTWSVFSPSVSLSRDASLLECMTCTQCCPSQPFWLSPHSLLSPWQGSTWMCRGCCQWILQLSHKVVMPHFISWRSPKRLSSIGTSHLEALDDILDSCMGVFCHPHDVRNAVPCMVQSKDGLASHLLHCFFLQQTQQNLSWRRPRVPTNCSWNLTSKHSKTF